MELTDLADHSSHVPAEDPVMLPAHFLGFSALLPLVLRLSVVARTRYGYPGHEVPRYYSCGHQEFRGVEPCHPLSTPVCRLQYPTF